MKAIAEITDRRVAQTMLEHVGNPSDAPEPWPARGPLASVGAFRGLDREPRADEPAPDVESSLRTTATGACGRDRADGRICGLGARRQTREHRADYRWIRHRAYADIATAAATQARLLERVATYVRAPGRLVYAVCSPEPEEGPTVAQTVLASMGLVLESERTWTPEDDGTEGFDVATLAPR